MSATEAKTELQTADTKRIMELLPHRPPMLLIDRMIDIVPHLSATGIRLVSISDPILAGHFPGYPIMPGVLIVEAMAQTAGALVMHSMNASADDKLVYFMSIDRARFRAPVMPGDVLSIPVKLLRARKPVWRFSGEAYVNGKLCAEAEYSAMIMDKNGKPANVDD
ncbi:MAG: 3-hydroxyacyl-ACP dehydratase FabZ [Alphaproteobacteria bacterium]|nr:3-hydroxyacyl-ACP dehydratase FabZ [Alphaproteobacteria bacterium]